MRLREHLVGTAILVLSLGIAGCSTQTERRAAGGAVRLAPDPATVTSQLMVVVDAASVDPVQCSYRWHRNESVLSEASGPALDPDKFRKGDRLAVEVTVPGQGGAPARTLRAEVRVADSPPVIREARVEADRSSGGNDLVAVTDCADPDGDATTASYRWFRNGQPVTGETGERLSATLFSRGDRIAFEAVASDGEQKSESRRSDEFVLSNRAPRFGERPASQPAPEGSFRYQAAASDPDGDPVRFELVQGPEGMTVSPTGAIDWTIPAKDQRQSEYAVRIRATDPNGGEATQDFTIHLTTEKRTVKQS